MIRQAHTYLAGAVSGTVLIAIAVIAFVVLVSLGALKDWPLADLGNDGDGPQVSQARPAPPGAGALGPTVAIAPESAGAEAGAQSGGTGQGEVGDSVTSENDPGPVGSQAPSAEEGSQPAGNDTAGSSPVRTTSTSSGDSPATATGNGGSGGSSGSSGGSGGQLSGAAANTVNEVVTTVDGATGGALGASGAGAAIEEITNDAVGPESRLGQTVDKATEAVGGLLDGDR